MATSIYRCPTTGHLVQGWIAEGASSGDAETYFPLTCLACRGNHFVNLKNGKVLDRGPVRICVAKDVSVRTR
jgi:hypothetical protein